MTNSSCPRSTVDERAWAPILSALLAGRDLTAADTSWVLTEVIGGTASPARLAGFLVALRAKGETAEEVAGLADALQDGGIGLDIAGPVVDLVGTGGDRTGAVNISTMASLVVAATGVRVVKHGGRGASTANGSADVLEALGVDLDLSPRRVGEVAAEVGITYCFAPAFHPGLRHAAPVRRELGIPTVFNVLAPLLNPARPRHQLVGVAPAPMTTVLAEVLARRGGVALVARGDDGLDKFTTTTTTQVWEVRDGQIAHHVVDPGAFGIPRARPADLRGEDLAANVRAVRRLLAGEPGPVRDVVLLNAAAARTTLAPADGPLPDRLAAELVRCAEAVDSGRACRLLEDWVAATRR
jgi:anthranilate phosphoribosyltransferase